MVLKELSELFGVSGNEIEVRNFLKNTLKNYVDNTEVDSIGNLIMFKKGINSSKKIMFIAHMDEVGLMVTKIDKNGFIKFSVIGGIQLELLPGQNVIVCGTEKIPGVIGVKPIHLQKSDSPDIPVKKESLYIDVGAKSNDELAGKINIGDTVCFKTEYSKFGNLIKGKAFDDRAGCSVIADLITKNLVPDFDTYFVFCVQEEVGLRGSRVATYKIQPDLVFVLEGTPASDIPSIDKQRWTTSLNKGPVITFMHNGLVIQKKVIEFIENVANNNNIQFQYKEKVAGGTDALAIAKTASGCYVGIISVPVRYIHSPVSVFSLEDYDKVVELTELIFSNTKTFFEINN